MRDADVCASGTSKTGRVDSMKHFAKLAVTAVAAFGTATAMQAQSLPDCRADHLQVGASCTFEGTTLPKQKYLGEITLPSSDHVRLTEPFPAFVAPPAPSLSHPISIGALFTVQTETLGYKAYVSSGVKAFANKQWSDLRGVEVRGTAVEFALGSVGLAPGNNHTAAVAAGPRISHSFGRVSPYGSVLLGVAHQYYYGMTESAVAGVSVRLSKHFSLIPVDGEYRYVSLQKSTALANPRRGRIEFSGGLVYSFGK